MIIFPKRSDSYLDSKQLRFVSYYPKRVKFYVRPPNTQRLDVPVIAPGIDDSQRIEVRSHWHGRCQVQVVRLEMKQRSAPISHQTQRLLMITLLLE
jgi:hypothetical protein